MLLGSLEMTEIKKSNQLATISLIFGILGWCLLPVVGSITAVITGHIARNQIMASNGTEDGEGLAVAGLILGWVAIGLSLMVLLLVITLFFFGAMSL